MPRNAIAELLYDVVCLAFKEISKLFSKVTVPFYLPGRVYEPSIFSVTLPGFCVVISF